MDDTSELLQAFNFEVTFTAAKGRSGPLDGYTGAFAECSGLELEAEIKDYNEGGFNDGVIRRVGRVKLVPLVLKRGMFVVGTPGGDGTADTMVRTALEPLFSYMAQKRDEGLLHAGTMGALATSLEAASPPAPVIRA